MSQWKNDDTAANSVFWAVAQYKTVANVANRAAFYGNTTANAYFAGVTVGQYGVDTNEAQAVRAAGIARPAHAGWVVRTEGVGGRAGRVSYETLVAMGSMTGDGADDSVLPDLGIVITTEPSSTSGNSTANEIVTFTVVASTIPAGGALTYKWTFANGTAMTDAGAYSNTGTATLSVLANTAGNGEQYYVELSTNTAINAISQTVTLTVTT